MAQWTADVNPALQTRPNPREVTYWQDEKLKPGEGDPEAWGRSRYAPVSKDLS